HFLERVERLDPLLRAFAELDHEGARDQARRTDRAVLDGKPLGPLEGVPISVKAHISMKGMKFWWGGRHGVARVDDLGVERVRKAGAMLIGTNTLIGSSALAAAGNEAGHDGGAVPAAEFKIAWDNEARNPWDLTRVPGWSSSGSAAAVAAALVPVAITSDGAGSSRIPAAYCGVVGVHATPNLTPFVDYDCPAFSITDSRGPMTRSVRDAA